MMDSIERCDAVENANTTTGAKQWRRGSKAAAMPRVVLASFALVWCLGSMIQGTQSFQTTTSTVKELQALSTAHKRPIHNNIQNSIRTDHGPLYMFGRKKDGDESESTNGISENDGSDEKKKLKIPFFGRLKRSKSDTSEESEDEPQLKERQTSVATVAAPTAAGTTTGTTTSAETKETAGPTELRPPKKTKKAPSADDLKLMAEKARLEAERLDAELTLSKIEKLEQQLIRSKKGENDGNVVVEDLQHQLDALQAKLQGEPVPVNKKVSAAAAASAQPEAKDTAASTSSSESSSPPPARISLGLTEVPRTGALAEIDDARVLEAAAFIAESESEIFGNVRTKEDLDVAPEFLLKIIGPFYGLFPDPKTGRIDKAELVDRWNRVKNLDYGFFENRDPPSFDRSDIRARKLAIMDADKSNVKDGTTVSKTTSSWIEVEQAPVTVTKKMLEMANGNATQVAIYSLEYEHYLINGIEELSSNPDVIAELFTNTSFFGTMYPKCVTNRGENKGDDYVSEEPTDAQIDVLMKTILPAVKFSSSAKPQKVEGGYTISGSHKYENGDELLEAIDKEITKSRPNLKDQLTVLYTPSYGLLSQIDAQGMNSMDMESIMNDPNALDIFAESEPILYITGPTIVRDANPVGLALASILGLATSWYLSVYPFLLNDKIASRIDADLQLVEANLQPDLSYLTDLSIPLFFSFMGLQFIHELAHTAVAASKGVKLSVPVFVPSLITGVTSTVTTFKTLPKNKNDMFDISAAGPLAGVIFSSLALAIGSKLTLISDPATLPALPLDILRQSTLGGAIIDQVITGSLYVPDGAPTAGITIPLHPLAIAGYVSLIVNALALLPIGSTDGGRLTMAIFDRAEKMSVGTLTLSALFFAGIFGSDLFLFYFSFCLAFQTGNEVPARNEQDSVEFSRIFVALVCYGLAILTLVPFQ